MWFTARLQFEITSTAGSEEVTLAGQQKEKLSDCKPNTDFQGSKNYYISISCFPYSHSIPYFGGSPFYQRYIGANASVIYQRGLLRAVRVSGRRAVAIAQVYISDEKNRVMAASATLQSLLEVEHSTRTLKNTTPLQ